jgi:hypothetical protein
LWENQEIRINMTKNMTRKGLAFGAGFALLLSGLAGGPAQAATVSGSIDLTPATGPKNAFAVVSADDKAINLTASTITSGASLKVLVNDPDGVVEPVLTVGTTPYVTKIAMVDSTNFTVVVAAKKATFTAANDLKSGDKVFFTADVVQKTDGTTALVADDTVFTVNVADSTTFSLVEDVAVTTQASVQLKNASNLKLVRTARSAGSYVVDTGVTAAGLTPVRFDLNSAAGTTFTAQVQAFADADGDNLIAAGALNEFVSPARTLTWVKAEDVVSTTVIDAPTIGAQTLTATVTTEPVLNGVQNNVAGAIKIAYTRQGSAVIGASANATQDLTTGAWTATGLALNTTVGDAANVDTWTPAAGAIDTTTDGSDWGFTRAIAGGAAETSVTTNVATTTQAAHLLRVGDKVLFAGGGDAALAGLTFSVASVPSPNTFTFALTRANTTTALAQTYTVTTLADANKSLVDGVFPGTYSARALILVAANEWQYAGPADVRGTFAATATDVKVTTVGSATVQGATFNTDENTNKVLVKVGQSLSVPVTATLVDKDGAAIEAGRAVLVRINSVTADVKVNAKTTNSIFYTDSNGQVVFNVTSVAGADGAAADIDVQPEGDNALTTRVIVEWDKQDYAMVELGMTGTGIVTPRAIAIGSSYDLQIGVLDEWFQAAPNAEYRIKVTGSGVAEGFVSLTDGRATIKVTDNKLSATTFSAVVTLQKTGTTGVFADVAGSAVTMVHNIAPAAATLVLASGGQTLYKATATVTTAAVAKVAIVELDKRLSLTPSPVYANNAVITGKSFNGSTAAGISGSVVTVTGPASVLIEEGNVAKRGSLTFLSDGTGEFAVKLYSTTAQKDTVITVTANGVSKEVKVTFTGIGVGEGVSLVVDMPAAVKPASTFQVKAKLADAFGNGVIASAGRVKVTYTGAGIVFGTLPDKTDANGDLMFSVLLGSNDTGTVSVTVSYDQNGDGDYVDTKDLVTTGTTAITASGVVAASSDTIVNVGTFSGKLVVYALNAAGSEVSYKIAGKWVTQVVTSDLLMRYDRVVGATGKTIKVDIYVDGVLKLAKSVVTK